MHQRVHKAKSLLEACVVKTGNTSSMLGWCRNYSLLPRQTDEGLPPTLTRACVRKYPGLRERIVKIEPGAGGKGSLHDATWEDPVRGGYITGRAYKCAIFLA